MTRRVGSLLPVPPTLLVKIFVWQDDCVLQPSPLPTNDLPYTLRHEWSDELFLEADCIVHKKLILR